MKTWQAILIAGALIAASIIVRVEPIAEVRAQGAKPNFSNPEALCILKYSKDVDSERMAELVHHACLKTAR